MFSSLFHLVYTFSFTFCVRLVDISMFFQIEALKAIGVSEVVLAINYQPEVSETLFSNTKFV